MGIRQASKILLLSSLVLNSCIIIDTKPLGYCIKNCTNDTLLIDLNEAKTLNDEIYWKACGEDSMKTMPDDTTTVFIHGKQVDIHNAFRVLPNTKSIGFPTLFNNDTCYLYVIKWQIVTSYSLEEIRSKRLYDMKVITKKDFDRNHILEYKTADGISIR